MEINALLDFAQHGWPFALAGLLVGFVVGLTGVGGGSLMTPILIFGFGIKPHLAVGTDLLFAAVTKSGGVAELWRQKRVDWSVVASLSIGSIPAALICVYALHQMGPASPQATQIMTTTLGLALLLTAAATAYKAYRGKSALNHHATAAESAEAAKPRHWALPIVFGALIGTLVSITSVGAGAIGVTVLILLYPMLPLPRIVGADLAYAVPLTLVAGLGHASVGSVNWTLLSQLLIGSLPGIWLGTRLVARAPDRLLRSLLSVLLAWAGLKLVAI
jgi:uncharacterized membrane protein YfcA